MDLCAPCGPDIRACSARVLDVVDGQVERADLAAGRFDQALKAQLGLAQHALAATLQEHALLEQRDRLFERQVARLELLDDLPELGQGLVERQRADALAFRVRALVHRPESRTVSTRAPSSPAWRRTLISSPFATAAASRSTEPSGPRTIE